MYEVDALGRSGKVREWKVAKLRPDPVWLSADTLVVHTGDRLQVLAIDKQQVVTEYGVPTGDLVIVGQ